MTVDDAATSALRAEIEAEIEKGASEEKSHV